MPTFNPIIISSPKQPPRDCPSVRRVIPLQQNSYLGRLHNRLSYALETDFVVTEHELSYAKMIIQECMAGSSISPLHRDGGIFALFAASVFCCGLNKFEESNLYQLLAIDLIEQRKDADKLPEGFARSLRSWRTMPPFQSSARRAYDLLTEGSRLRDSGDVEGEFERVVEALACSPSGWNIRYPILIDLSRLLKQNPGLMTDKIRHAMKRLYGDSNNEPILHRTTAALILRDHYMYNWQPSRAEIYTNRAIALKSELDNAEGYIITTAIADRKTSSDDWYRSVSECKESGICTIDEWVREVWNVDDANTMPCFSRLLKRGRVCDYEVCGMVASRHPEPIMDETKLLRSCAACRRTYYCSVKCQKEHWKEGHRYLCRPSTVFRTGDLVHGFHDTVSVVGTVVLMTEHMLQVRIIVPRYLMPDCFIDKKRATSLGCVKDLITTYKLEFVKEMMSQL